MQPPENEPLHVGLTLRAMLLVTIALLPLGLIATWQTHQIIEDDRLAGETALIAATEKAAAREQRIIERAVGAATAMGNTAYSLRYDSPMCQSILSRFERSSTLYSFVAFAPASGSPGCSSAPAAPDDSGDGRFAALITSQRLGLYVERDPAAPENSVLIVATPAFENGRYVGHMRLHAPQANFEKTEPLDGDRPLGLVTFNQSGDILTSEKALAKSRALLPREAQLGDLIMEDPYTFTATSQKGVERVYAFVPLVEDAAYALGTWNTDVDVLQADAGYWRTIILAVLMWLGSLLVVFLIMQLLVIRRVRRLRNQVRRFRDTRDVPLGAIDGRGELYDLEEDFRAMTETIIQDEAQLENAVHEKNVLLKEVHHRVKNNLQLINSIINMILRTSNSAETRTVVRRLQDRVMALASVHRSIYQAHSMDRVDAAEIVREIVNQGIAIGLPRGSDVDVQLDLSPVSLYPDQAMPLSLLVSEAITNVLKYTGGDAPFIAVSLSRCDATDADSADTATLTIANSVGATAEIEDAVGTGLGSQLLRAFSHQLGSEATTTRTDELYTLDVTFDIAAFDPEDNDLAEAAE